MKIEKNKFIDQFFEHKAVKTLMPAYRFKFAPQNNWPSETCNGKYYEEYPKDSYEIKHWGENYWKWKHFENVLDIIMYENAAWKSLDAMVHAFQQVHKFYGTSRKEGVTTNMFLFEIELLNNGFEIGSFCELNAMIPSYTIIGEKNQTTNMVDVKFTTYRRSYVKNGLFVHLGFGLFPKSGGRCNFYFQLSNNMSLFFQVTNDLTKFNDAIEGKLKPIDTSKGFERNYEFVDIKQFKK